MFDGKAFGAEIVGIVKGHIERSLAPLLARLDTMEKALADLPAPKDGEPGSSVTLDDVAPMVKAEAERVVDDLLDEAKAIIADAIKEEAECILAGWERPKDGAPGERGADGAPGINGKDGADIIDVVIDREGNAVFTLSDGRMKNVGLVVGKDGEPGRDGANGSDGAPGKDGADGFGFDDLEFEHDGERGFKLKFIKGDAVKEFPFSVPMVLDRGVFKEGNEYAKGDGVTWGRHYWIAKDATKDEPKPGSAWRLAVKSGRDGKDGQMLAPREIKPIKVG